MGPRQKIPIFYVPISGWVGGFHAMYLHADADARTPYRRVGYEITGALLTHSREKVRQSLTTLI